MQIEIPKYGEKEREPKPLNWDNVTGREMPKFDVTPYVGKKVKISNVTEIEDAKYGAAIDIETDAVGETLAGKPLTVRKRFWLSTDKEGNVFYGLESKLAIFLKRMGVTNYKEVIGREVILNYRTDKHGSDWLSFG